MNMFPTITTNETGVPVAVSVTFEDGSTFSSRTGDKFFDRLLNAIKSFNTETVFAILNPVKKIREWTSSYKQLTISGGEVKFEGQLLKGSLVDAIIERISMDLSIDPFVKCLHRLMSNPSPYVREKLWDFVSGHNLALTETGDICLYKHVMDDYWSWYTNGLQPAKITDLNDPTLVHDLENGRVPYYPGTHVHMDREHVNPDSRVSCSHGLHVGSYQYNNIGQRTLVVAVGPENVVAIPFNDSEKVLRVSDMDVIGEIGDRLPNFDIIHDNYIKSGGVIMDHGFTNKLWDSKKEELVDEPVNEDGEPNEPVRVDPKTGSVSFDTFRNYLRDLFKNA